MLSPGDTRPGEDREVATDHLFRTLCRLVPNSGIQFLDISIPRQTVDSVIRRFVEERLVIAGEPVWGLAPGPSGSDAADAELRVAARTILPAILDRWVPLPYLRFVARDGSGRARFDQGPNNWARLFIASSPGPTSDAYAAVIAFDTRTDSQSRLDIDSYVMPTSDDVRFASTFALTDDAEELASFLAEGWVQDWIQGLFPHVQPSRPTGAPLTLGLQQIAGYLTLLTVLRRAVVTPSLQFFDTSRDAVTPIPVDMVLDIGTSRSAALLVESPGGRPQLSHARLLDLRDLGEPTRTHHGAFESRIAFDRTTFGSDALSRRSGRADAFAWPSLARTGPEAARLASRTASADGAVSVAEPKAHLRDQVPRSDMWRFAPDPRAGTGRGAMISGRLLHPTTPISGLLTGPETASKSVALRPRHALTTMSSFLIAELVQQAMCAINAPARADRTETEGDDAVRTLRQIVLPVPLTMPIAERDLLRARAESAVDMIWSALGWNTTDESATHLPEKPLIRLGLDETLAAQLVYLYDEIAHRFRGDARALLDVLGKSRPEFGVQPCLRFGAVDIGGGHATMTIVTYAASGDAPISPNLLGAQRSKIAGTTLLDGVASALLVPTIARAISSAGGENAPAYLEALLAPDASEGHEPTALGTRLTEFWLRPAALALLDLTTGLTAHAATQTLTVTLGDLIASRGPFNAAVGVELTATLEAIRAAHVDFSRIPIVIRVSEVTAAARTVLEPMLASLSRALVASDCDAVLLTGWASRLAVVRALLIEQMPWHPGRIVSLTDHAWQSWYPMSEADRTAAGGKDIALVGALLALAGGERLGFGDTNEFGLGAAGYASAAGDGSDGWRAAAPATQSAP